MLAQHVVDVSEHLAEGKSHLVRIVDGAPEHRRHQVGGGARRPRGTPARSRGSAPRGARAARRCAHASPTNGRLWPGSTRTSLRDVALQARERTQVDAERIALGIHRLHADIGRDAGQHLIRANQQVLGATIEHHLLGRMSAAGENLEAAGAEPQQLAGDQAAERARQTGDHAQIAMTAGEQALAWFRHRGRANDRSSDTARN